MTGLDALQSVQFLTKKGKRLAILSAEDWKCLVEWLETLEDTQIARQAFADLKAAKGSRRRAGWFEMERREGQTRVSRYELYIAPAVLAVRKRPPYDYGDLESLIEDFPSQ